MRLPVSKKYNWEFDGVKIEGIIEYVGHDGIIASRWPHKRCTEPRVGDFVDFREWLKARDREPHPYSVREFGVIDAVDYLEDGVVHICTGGASVYLGRSTKEGYAAVSISGGPFGRFYQEDLEPTMELKRGRYWNFREGSAQGDNGQDYYIKRPVFKMKPDARDYVYKEIDYDDD